ncbi:Sec-dependent nitrous-oxide reductase [Opitutus terrae]|uniref:Nitrous-oxide reductase n=1 Tax=Opitutus terrae (strain DSM 11246 / JCM 15787 / PB90-1) TaxID=452637 RepID=B1ZWX6_OPITP|nr:Sec-dependent nitrous-oxide reductase [Opitutus terrae]ACB75087.1 Nitrous-oxide reductase [Opitutus terrae PB90-1]
MKRSLHTPLALSLLSLTVLLGGCGRPGGDGAGNGKSGKADANSAAVKTYVAPGQKDEFYLFYSGGHSGQIFVAGIPSMRHLITIPVFTPSPGTGYGFDEETKKMLGGYTWGDVHHPGLSQTDGKYDGRWLFVNDNANNRIARVDLRDFKTKQILGPIPNSSGNHGSSFVTENTENVLVATRFSVPLPKGRYAELNDYEKEFNGMVSGIKVDPQSGEMSVGWQILTPPFDWDLGSTGKGPSSGWAFWTSYNTEMAHDQLEVNASQRERDYAAVVNWKAAEAAVREGKGTDMDGVPVIDPAKVPGVLYFLPVPKSPHGIDVDPSGRWIAAGGKLQPTASVFDFEKIRVAIEKRDFEGEFRGVPILRFESVLEGEVPVGLGPLHTQYDGKGNAYTSLFIESVVTKWKLPPWTDEQKKDLSKAVIDKIPVHFNIGHLVIGGSDTKEPYGRYLVAGNKLSKGRHLSTGPSQPESSQLIDITGEKMAMLYETFTDPEPHFMQILKADVIKPIEVYPKAENKNPNAVWDAKDTSVTRSGNTVEVKALAIRSHFAPERIDAQVGDEVVVHLTNVEQTPDMIHGWGLAEHDINIIVDPGETKTVRFKVTKPGVFPFYCTNFCSALHQEMQGYLAVKPASTASTAPVPTGAGAVAAMP